MCLDQLHPLTTNTTTSLLCHDSWVLACKRKQKHKNIIKTVLIISLPKIISQSHRRCCHHFGIKLAKKHRQNNKQITVFLMTAKPTAGVQKEDHAAIMC